VHTKCSLGSFFLKVANCISYKVWCDDDPHLSVYSDTTIEPLDPPADCKPGDRVYAEGYDNGIHDSLYVMCAVLFCFLNNHKRILISKGVGIQANPVGSPYY